MLFFTPIQKFANAYDPNRDAIVHAIEATIPALIATAVYLYFRKPMSSLFLYMPSYCLVLTFFFPTYKGKITVMAVTFFLTALGVFFVNALYNHIYTMMLVLFPILLVIFGSIKYKYAAALAPTLIAIAIALPPGWYEGTNRCIEIFFSFVVATLCLIFYELFFAKYRIRAHIKYVSELITDLFSLYTAEDKTAASKKIKYTHLFKKHSLYRTDIVSTKVFSDDLDRFSYKVNLVLNRALQVIFYEDHIFAQIKFFVYGFRDVLTLYRRVFRNISLMTSYSLNMNQLCSHVELTDKFIENLNARLISQNSAIKMKRTPDKSVKDFEHTEKWKANLEKCLANPPADLEKEEAAYLLAIKYILHDIDTVRSKLRKINYGS